MSVAAVPDAEAPGGDVPLRVVPLGEGDRDDLLALIVRDPLVNVAAEVRVRTAPNLSTVPGLLGVRGPAGDLRAAVLDIGNLLPVGGGPAEWEALGARLAFERRTCSSIVGRADAVAVLWDRLRPVWGPARAVRQRQPLLAVSRLPRPRPGDPRVRAMQPADVDRYLPAAAAMFAEELGVDPVRTSGAGEYRRRIGNLIAAGRAYGIVDDTGRVVFKADLGAISPHTCQVQGVWVHPDLRGRGLATAALATVLDRALERAPVVSLYVNDYNAPARRVYARLGMTERAVLTTVLF